MKKTIIILLSFLFFSKANAQILKGSIPLAGSVSFNNNSNSWKDTLQSLTTNNLTYSVAPTIGYFITNNLAVGLGISYSYSKSLWEEHDGASNSIKKITISDNLQFAPYLSYYIHLSDKAYVSINGSVGYTMPLSYDNKTEYYSTTGTTVTENKKVNSYSINANLAPGVLYFINNKFALKGSIGSLYYNYYHSQNNNVSYSNYQNSTTSGLNFNLSGVSLGVQYFLVRKKSE